MKRITTLEMARSLGMKPARLRAKVRYHRDELKRYMVDEGSTLHEFHARNEPIVRAILKLPPVDMSRH
jgi:hypothetical protein